LSEGAATGTQAGGSAERIRRYLEACSRKRLPAIGVLRGKAYGFERKPRRIVR